MRFLHKQALDFYAIHFDFRLLLRYILPLSIAMTFAKILTYTSYGLIPVSLTHTVKALTPFFNVFIVYLWVGESVSFPTLLSLIPIIVGVIYASVNEIEFISIQSSYHIDLIVLDFYAHYYQQLLEYGKVSI